MSRQEAKNKNSLLSDAQKQYDLCLERLKTMSIEPKLLSNGFISLPYIAYAKTKAEIRSDKEIPIDFSLPDTSQRPFKVGYFRRNQNTPYKTRTIWTTLKHYQNIFIKKMNQYATNPQTDPLQWHQFVYAMLMNSSWQQIELPALNTPHMIKNPNAKQQQNPVVLATKYNWDELHRFEQLPNATAMKKIITTMAKIAIKIILRMVILIQILVNMMQILAVATMMMVLEFKCGVVIQLPMISKILNCVHLNTSIIESNKRHLHAVLVTYALNHLLKLSGFQW